MSDDHANGFLKHDRWPIGYRDPRERVHDYREIYKPTWEEKQLQEQGERCMDCGVPTCMAGCPIGNIIPEWNDLVYRGNWRAALERLHATNNFPEFTGYTCPAPCEPACVLAYNNNPVTIKSIERAIVDKGWQEGWIMPQPPKTRSGHKVAIVGSGPAGLAAAQQLNRVGHEVTVYERDDAIGGLMTYGIPDFKFAKYQVARRVDQLKQEGILFQTNADVGVNIPFETLRGDFDAVCLAIGALKQRDVPLPGRELNGIMFAMEYLIQENRRQAQRPVENGTEAKGKNVIVLGGGDTGADCIATAHRQGARQVIQISINPQKPLERPEDNPWPELPWTYEKTYAQEEGGEEVFNVNTVAFVDDNDDGHVDYLSAERAEWTYDNNRKRIEKKIIEPDFKIPADLVLIAIGFAGAEADPFKETGIEIRKDGTIKVDANMMTDLPGVFAAGDANRGQSIVVWAIGEGRDVARCIDTYLMGASQLPRSLRTQNPPIGL
ncbi:MAG: glutamate synthase subunit beta [Gammaproteobacteria bacterium]|nr:glutamate synthase subunit beta [Gammaproteobacteria bacterium]MCI0591556.1 glutamate synthase subunit beta [Gammaproteobacteria bacterium]